MSYLATAKKAREEYRRRKQHDSGPMEAVVDRIVEESAVAILIDSEILGHPIWFSLRDDWQPDESDATPVCYASELAALRTKTTEDLRSIFTNVKRVFGGGMVRQ